MFSAYSLHPSPSSTTGKADWPAVKDGPSWAADSWGLGCLLQEVFSGGHLKSVEQLRSTDPVPPDLLPSYQKLLAGSAGRRLSPKKLLTSEALDNQVVSVVEFLDQLAVKDSAEKDVFFRKLSSQLSSLPTAVNQRKVLPLIGSALEFGGAPAVALGALLSIGKTLSEDDVSVKVIPIVSRLFASSDRAIRRSLLESIPQYGKVLTERVVEQEIFPHVVTGFADTNPYIRELTLKSMLTMAPKLS